jgi:hypothetical protein
VQVAVDSAHHDLARVEAHPDLDGHTLGALHVSGVGPHRGLHGQGRVAGADRVVLLGQRGTEQRHDPVTQHLVDGALIPAHSLDHAFEDRVEQAAGVFGVAVGQEFQGPLEVGEEDGDLLALPLTVGGRGDPLFGQVPGPGAGAGRTGTVGSAPALRAEPGARGQLRTTAGTAHGPALRARDAGRHFHALAVERNRPGLAPTPRQGSRPRSEPRARSPDALDALSRPDVGRGRSRDADGLPRRPAPPDARQTARSSGPPRCRRFEPRPAAASGGPRRRGARPRPQGLSSSRRARRPRGTPPASPHRRSWRPARASTRRARAS